MGEVKVTIARTQCFNVNGDMILELYAHEKFAHALMGWHNKILLGAHNISEVPQTIRRFVMELEYYGNMRDEDCFKKLNINRVEIMPHDDEVKVLYKRICDLKRADKLAIYGDEKIEVLWNYRDLGVNGFLFFELKQ